ncbi:outer membrane protein assembly factor BamB family protein [Stieleria varia]|uniref:Outer membrane biogenesis protein BamB n=1 Tax=Stieleria varia TaxID=2528005 RepID=A0A5C5ZWN6_9BACT|nr:PQQ-binding-like beta-propeller repeat protein [Stieleria varia]TWT92032.1 outer membrane biogenesis protein BamB [Stieleria varia]
MTKFFSAVSMRFTFVCGLLMCCMHATPAGAQEWPQWRGPNGDNHAAADASAPLKWDLQTGENVIWKTRLPGRGHSTPVIIDEGIFLTTADSADETQSLLKLDRVSGKLIDRWVLHRGDLPRRIHPNNSYASPSVAFDGHQLYVAFQTSDAIHLTAMTPDGREVWAKRVSDFKPAQFEFGYGASPIVEGELVIVAAEYDGPDSGLYGLSTRTGEQVWKVPRPSNLNFATPIVATIAGQRQLLIAGANTIDAYDPLTGRTLWQVDATTEAICGTIAVDGRRILVSGGNPVSGTWCVTGDATGKLLWENGVKCYEQSLLTIPNHVFAIADNGVGYCWRTMDGKEMWRSRLFAGGVSASPTLIGNRVYAANESGEVAIFSASPDRFEPLAKIQTGDSIFATPIAVGDRLYIRTGINENGRRQEYLIALGSH